jgi:rhodanese-related sulfurtransferase
MFFVLLAMIIASVISSQIANATAISTTQAVQMVNQRKGVFVDIRGETDYAKGHIADSLSIQSSSLLEGASTIKDKQKPVIIVSANGQGTLPIAKQLQGNGFSEVYILKGGIQNWKEAKLPLFS